MHPGGERRGPQHHNKHDVRRAPPLVRTGEQEQQHEADNRDTERHPLHGVGVDDADDRHREEVVDNSERQQEHAQLARHLGADQRERTEQERRVSADDGAPRFWCVAACDGEVDECWQHNAGDSGHDRDKCLAAVAQRADRELLANLEADEEEEDDHEAVVHPVVQAHVDAEVADTDRGVRLPEVDVRLRPGRVRPQQREDRDAHEQQRAPRLGAQPVGHESYPVLFLFSHRFPSNSALARIRPMCRGESIRLGKTKGTASQVLTVPLLCVFAVRVRRRS